MTKYIDHILQPGERRLYSGKIHWIVYVPGLILLIAALFFLLLASAENASGDGWMRGLWIFAAALCLIVSAILLFWEWFVRWTTEIEVTDRRIIYKRGFIRRDTVEMHMDKVESVDVVQSIPGRLLNYGHVTIRGVGVGISSLPRQIASPLQLRNHITGVETAGKT
jgi:uncharacterized membrane protein YdbT with pleckstrin-like domain